MTPRIDAGSGDSTFSVLLPTIATRRKRNRARWRPFQAAFLAILVSACGDTSNWSVTDTAEAGDLFLAPAQIEMDNNTTRALSLNLSFSDGRVSKFTGPVTWSSSSPAVVAVLENGEVSARLPGTSTITARTTRGTASANVRVLPVNADLRLVVPDSIAVPAGLDGGTLVTARVVDVTGAPVSGLQVDFSVLAGSASMSPAQVFTDQHGFARTTFTSGTVATEILAEVSSPGLEASGSSAAAAPGNGQGKGPLKKEFRARVKASHPHLVTIAPDPVRMDLGQATSLEATVEDAFGNTITNPSIAWSSSDTKVVQVDSESGRITAQTTGLATIRATASDDSGASAEGTSMVEVAGSSATRLDLTLGDQQSALVGETLLNPLALRVLDASGSGVAGVAVSWAVVEGSATLGASTTSTDPSGATSVSVRLGSEAGRVRVRASANSLSPITYTLEAVPGAVTSVQVTPSGSEVVAGESVALSAAAVDRFGNIVPGGSYVWASSNAQVASVTSAGVVSGNAAGNATVSARRDGVTGSAAIAVTATPTDGGGDGGSGGDDGSDPTPTSLHVSAAGSTNLTALGQSVQLTVTARDANGSAVSTPPVTWSTSNSSVATVNSSGLVTANAVGTALISVMASCCTADEITIGVSQQVASVAVSPGSAYLTAGSNQSFVADPRDGNGHPVPGLSINWSSSNTSVATVNGSGTVSAVGAGSASIRASAAGVTGQGTVSVTAGGTSGSSSYPNEPTGYATRFNDGFDYSGVSLNEPWFEINGSNLNGRFALGGRPSISRENNGQPFNSNSAFRAFYPGGMPGGHDAARLAIPLSGTTPGGFYLAYTMRLPQEWHTMANELQNGIKHVIPWVIPSDGSEVRPLGWSGMAQNPRGDNRYRIGFTLENISPETFRRYNIPYVNEAASEFGKGDWIMVELHVRFDSSGPGTGLIELFVNGNLVAREVNARVPVERLRNVTIAGTYGGGIGNVPHDMWYDVGHFYVSTPGG
jgi:uncharacterized protein YjdB